MRMRTRPVIALATYVVGFFLLSAPAQAEWPLDFNAPAAIRTGADGTVILESNTSFARYLTPEIQRVGYPYLQLDGFSIEARQQESSVLVALVRVRLLRDDGPEVRLPPSAVRSLPLADDAWSVVTWRLRAGAWTRAVRLLQVDLGLTVPAQTQVTARGVEFAAASGARLGWEVPRTFSAGSRDGRAAQVRVVYTAQPSRVRYVSLWLRGSGRIGIGSPEVRAIMPGMAVVVVACGTESPRRLEIPGLGVDTRGLERTSGVQDVRLVGPAELVVKFGPQQGWQGVSVPLATRGSVPGATQASAVASVEILDTEGMARFAVEEYDDAALRRVAWHEEGIMQEGELLALTLSPRTDRLGFSGLREESPRGYLALRLRLGWQISLTGVALAPDETTCTIQEVAGTHGLSLSGARLGFRVDGPSLTATRFSRTDALIAAPALLVLVGSMVLWIALILRRGRGFHSDDPSAGSRTRHL